MRDAAPRPLRDDCRASLARLPSLAARLDGHSIAVVGGTGFVGSWIAESAAVLNDELGSRVKVHLLGRSASRWSDTRAHLKRPDVTLHTLDVRSPFELPGDTTLVLFAAGIADPRVHASDPHRAFQTHVYGIDHTLVASARLEGIQRVVNVSSGLVLGNALPARALSEADLGILDFTRFHSMYPESRRAAESLACVYAGQYRIPVSTARAFTFLGPYQPLDAPWALNNFMRDALSGKEIRIHGDGTTRRSYLYGSDVAAWLLKALLDGKDGEIYNIGGNEPVSHGQAATWVAALAASIPQLLYKSQPNTGSRNDDFFPDVGHTMQALGVGPVFGVQAAIERSMRWHALNLGEGRRLRPNT